MANVFVFANKTTNIYEVTPQKTYKKPTECLEKAVIREAKQIAKNINIDTRVQSLTKTPAFSKLKDHKSNFMFSYPFHLINTCKSELDKISTTILEKTNIL